MKLMKHAPVLSEQAGDIQAVLGSGLSQLTASRFWLLTVGDATEARSWLSTLLASQRIRSVADLSKESAFDEAVAVAFSFEGLRALGFEESDDFPFPTAFRSGMGSDLRQGLLRDPEPERDWLWKDTATENPVHLLVAHWCKSDATQSLSGLPPGEPHPRAFKRVASVQGCPSFFKPTGLEEPFGFRDGLSQPIPRGLRAGDSDKERRDRSEAGEFYRDRLVAPGEFILGYPNEYDQRSYLPDLKGWPGARAQTAGAGRFSLNGSYLAVRQIEQDVAAFERLTKDVHPGCDASVAEKAMGRRRNGFALCLPEDGAGMGESRAEAFRYRLEDADGLMCPLGSHVRRVNPRDALGADAESGLRASRLHRLLRRGRPYKEKTAGDDEKQGLFFIACNADLERQFEFVYQRWLHNPRFAGLEAQDDPIVGTAAESRRVSLPALPTGSRVSLEAYTRTVGGGYFFLPGIEALRFIAGGESRDGETPVSTGPNAASAIER